MPSSSDVLPALWALAVSVLREACYSCSKRCAAWLRPLPSNCESSTAGCMLEWQAPHSVCEPLPGSSCVTHTGPLAGMPLLPNPSM